MTGEQLNEYIARINQMLINMEDKFPELSESINDKRGQIAVLEYFTENERLEHPEDELSSDAHQYATKAVQELLTSGPEVPKTYIDYSPMYMEIAKYSLNISRICEILGISNNTRSLISKNKLVHISVLKKIADFLDCTVKDLFEFIDEDEYLRRLEKHALFNTNHKSDRYTDPVSILQDMNGVDIETYSENIRQVRRDNKYIIGAGQGNRRIMDHLVENMDGRERTVLRHNLAHNRDKIVSDFVNSVMDYYNDERSTLNEDVDK